MEFLRSLWFGGRLLTLRTQVILPVFLFFLAKVINYNLLSLQLRRFNEIKPVIFLRKAAECSSEFCERFLDAPHSLADVVLTRGVTHAEIVGCAERISGHRGHVGHLEQIE